MWPLKSDIDFMQIECHTYWPVWIKTYYYDIFLGLYIFYRIFT